MSNGPRLAPRWSSRRLLAAAALALIGALVLLWLAFEGGTSREAVRVAEAPSQAADAPRERERDSEQPAADDPRSAVPRESLAFGRAVAWIEIDAIGVKAPVIRLGQNRDRTLEVPGRASEAGWWSGGSVPGRRGSAVIVGHVDSHSGPGVFFRLRELRPGEEVLVRRRSGATARFVVTGRRQVAKNRFPTTRVYKNGGPPTLRLVTCSGRFDRSRGHYPANLIVFARLASARTS